MPTRTFSYLLTAIAFLLVFACGFHSLFNADYWFHLRVGEMLASGSIPKVDTFSYSAAGNEYLDPHWLFQLALYGLHRIGGVPLAIWTKCLVLLLTFFLLWKASRSEAPVLAVAVSVMLAAVLASERFIVRPEVATFCLLATVIWALQKQRDGSRLHGWIVPVVFLVWVNVESVFIIGFVPLATAIVDRPRDHQLYWITAASALATVVNPYHIHGALHPFEVFKLMDRSLGVYPDTIGELFGPFSSLASPHPASTVFPVFLGILGLALLASRRPRRGELLTLAVFLVFSFMARRNLALLAIVSVPILSRWIAVASTQAPVVRAAGATFARAEPLVLALVSLAGLIYIGGLATNRIYAAIGTNRQFGAFEAEVGFAREAAEFCRENGVRGPIFATLSSGSFLIWANPEEPVFIDGRLEVYLPEFFARYLSLLQGGQAWQDADREFAFNALLLDYGEAWNLAQERIRDGTWAWVHLDGKAVVLLRRTEANLPLIEAFFLDRERLVERFTALKSDLSDDELLPATPGLLHRWFGRRDFPWSEINKGQFFMAIGAHDLAAEQFRRAVHRDPLAATPRVLFGIALNQLGRPTSAIEVVNSAVPLVSTREERSRLAAAQGGIYTILARPREALDAYDRYLNAVGEGPQTAMAQLFRGKAKLDLGDAAGAIGDISTALGYAPGYTEGYLLLGIAQERAGRAIEALEAYRRYRQMGGQAEGVLEAIERLETEGS